MIDKLLKLAAIVFFIAGAIYFGILAYKKMNPTILYDRRTVIGVY